MLVPEQPSGHLYTKPDNKMLFWFSCLNFLSPIILNFCLGHGSLSPLALSLSLAADFSRLSVIEFCKCGITRLAGMSVDLFFLQSLLDRSMTHLKQT